MRRSISAAALPLLSALLAAEGAVAAPGQVACEALAAPGLFGDTTVTATKLLAADPAKHLPEFCEVTATVSPVKASHIGVVFRLPAPWNGKLLGLGGGGWAGNVKIEGAMGGLGRGYATLQTDGGHASAGPWDSTWADHGSPAETAAALADFSYRAIHEMTVVGKAVAAKYYGQAQSRAYYQGCSTGGREGLIEAQRFPKDYNGIISGAPVYDLVVQTTGLFRNTLFDAPDTKLTAAQLALVNTSVLKACDATDGLADGIVTDPRTCHWDPGQLQCKPGASGDDCLGDGQVAALRKAYTGEAAKDGSRSAYPYTRGSELAWTQFLQLPDPIRGAKGAGGLADLRAAMFGDPAFDLAHFDPDRDLKRMHQGVFAKEYEATDPDVSPFLKDGGKLLMWHGFYDPGPSPLATIDYFTRMEQVTGARLGAPVGESARLFLAPGVYHCRGGPGPDQFDALGALDRWVEQGKAPDRIIATKKDAKISRPLCPYPALPRYSGSGDPDDAANFVCR